MEHLDEEQASIMSLLLLRENLAPDKENHDGFSPIESLKMVCAETDVAPDEDSHDRISVIEATNMVCIETDVAPEGENRDGKSVSPETDVFFRDGTEVARNESINDYGDNFNDLPDLSEWKFRNGKK